MSGHLKAQAYDHIFGKLVAGEFPPGCTGLARHGLFTYPLPFLEQGNIYDQIDLEGNTHIDPQRYTPISTYVCPSYSFETIRYGSPAPVMDGALTTYQGVGGVFFTRKQEHAGMPHYGQMPYNEKARCLALGLTFLSPGQPYQVEYQLCMSFVNDYLPSS